MGQRKITGVAIIAFAILYSSLMYRAIIYAGG